MKSDRLAEFVAVLVFALTFGAGTWLVLRCLGAKNQLIALLVLIAAAILAWRYLRRRFGRG